MCRVVKYHLIRLISSRMSGAPTCLFNTYLWAAWKGFVGTERATELQEELIGRIFYLLSSLEMMLSFRHHGQHQWELNSAEMEGTGTWGNF